MVLILIYAMNQVVQRVGTLGREMLMVMFNLKVAYRNVLVHPDDRWMLGMEWKGIVYVDLALPFESGQLQKILAQWPMPLSSRLGEKELRRWSLIT